MEKWMVSARKADFNGLAKKFSIDPVIVRIIINRGIKTEKEIENYLYGDLQGMHDGSLMKDMDLGIHILNQAIKENDLICISSDFDVDGIFSGYILWRGIRRVGGRAYIVAPDRVKEGYGLNERIVEEAYGKGAGCILTCDNGIAAMEAVKAAKEMGMSVVVTDHHEVVYRDETDVEGNIKRTYILPEADAVIDPKRKDCPYPFKGLCGGGVAYKLIEQLYEYYHIPKQELYELIPFTAIATVADVMDLVDENRIIVKYGLHGLSKIEHLGLQSLIRHCGLDKNNISAYHIGFVIGPCFNAAGRLETAEMAFKLLQTEEWETAERLSAELVELNESRKEMTVQGYEQAVAIIEKEKLNQQPVIVLCLKDCHESLVGIIAGRIKEKYYRPVIVGTENNGIIKASGRSIEAYNMYEKLSECRDLFERFGGHAMAAGLSIRKENFSILRDRLNAHSGLSEADLMQVVHIDVPMPLEYISEDLIEELELLEPFGKGNVKPIFAEPHFNILQARILGKNKNVLKMIVMNAHGCRMEALYFGDIQAFEDCIVENFGEEAKIQMYCGRKNSIDMAFTYYPSINEYNGRRNIQIIIQNFQRILR